MYTKRMPVVILLSAIAPFGAAASIETRALTLLPRESSAGSSLGAFYFMSNDPDDNRIIASRINADGTLTPASATSTRGKGGVGTVTPAVDEHPDALFTQDSVKVAGNTLFNVNAGDNTLSMFKINKNDPTKLSLVATADTGGKFPTSVAVNKAGTMACALNSGGQSNFMCFAISSKGMKAIKNSQRSLGVNQTDIPTGPGGTVSDIVFMNDGNLAVSVKGTGADAPGNVQTFAVKGQQVSANSTATPAAKGGALPFSLSVPLDGSNQLFATDAAAGVSTFDFGSGQGNAAGTSTLTAIKGQGATCWSTQTKDTGSFFVSDVLTSHITEFAPPTAGEPAKQLQTYALGNGTGTIDLAAANTGAGDFVYVTGAKAKTITAMSTGKTAGNAKQVQTLDLEQQIGCNVPLTQNMQGAAVFVTLNK